MVSLFILFIIRLISFCIRQWYKKFYPFVSIPLNKIFNNKFTSLLISFSVFSIDQLNSKPFKDTTIISATRFTSSTSNIPFETPSCIIFATVVLSNTSWATLAFSIKE